MHFQLTKFSHTVLYGVITEPILLHRCDFSVTKNLYAALRRLWYPPKYALFGYRRTIHLFRSILNQPLQKLEVGNLYFLRGLISVSIWKMCSSYFETEIHEYIY